MKVYPKITVITVVYNARDDLRRTFESVFSQVYPNLEYVVIDGGSTDGTLELIKEHKDKISYFVSEKDDGIYDAMNKGILASKGEYINFMNAGDCYSSQDTLLQVSECSVDADIIYGWHRVIYSNKKVRLDYSRIPNGCLPRCMPVSHQSLFIKSGYLKKFSFNKKFDLAADYLQLCQCLNNGASSRSVESFVADVLAGGVSDVKRVEVWRQYKQIYGMLRPLRVRDQAYYGSRIAMEPFKRAVKSVLRVSGFYR